MTVLFSTELAAKGRCRWKMFQWADREPVQGPLRDRHLGLLNRKKPHIRFMKCWELGESFEEVYLFSYFQSSLFICL